MFDGLDGMDKANALYLAILLVVVLLGSASLRNIGFGRGLRMAAAWVAIFAVILITSSIISVMKTLMPGLMGLARSAP